VIRPKSLERLLRLAALAAGDFLIGWWALWVVVELRRHVDVALIPLLPPEKFALDLPNMALFAVSLNVALALSGFYDDRMALRTRPSFITAAVIHTALIAIGGAALVRPLPRTVIFAVPILEIAVLPLWRHLLGFVAPIRTRETILVGEARDVVEAISGLHLSGDRRVRVSEVCRPRPDQLSDFAVQADLRSVEEVILVSPDADPRIRLELLRIRGARGFLMLASHVDALLASRTRGWIGDQPLVEVAASCGYGVSAAVKRSIDLVGTALLMFVSAPLWVLAWAAIRIEDGGPALVRQRRVGLHGETYGMWKFRSMRGSADPEVHEDGRRSPPHSERVTRVGSLLRRYHVDELPQLINVLSGQMSLVGPRPERPELTARILKDLPDFDLRSLVRPGIAGLAQVSGEYDTRPEVKLRYDLMYMCDWSVWLDVRLMFRAVAASLAGAGR